MMEKGEGDITAKDIEVEVSLVGVGDGGGSVNKETGGSAVGGVVGALGEGGLVVVAGSEGDEGVVGGITVGSAELDGEGGIG